MNAKKTIKKILALGAGVTMVGATVMGAMAYDLASYPAPFITNGVFSGKIVVGEKAATSDVMGSIDIASSLQALSVSQTPVQIPGASGQVSLSGDSFQIQSASNKLALREPVSNVTDTLTSDNLAALKGGQLTTSQGTTSYNQYLRFRELNASGSNELQDFGVNYITNNQNVLGDYMVIKNSGLPFFEWEMQFGQGLKSSETLVSGTSYRLQDMEDETLNIFGTDYSIVSAVYDSSSTGLTLTMMGGSSPATLQEGETKTFTINGVDYEVTLVFVSDPSSGSTAPQAKFMVNGEVTKSLYEGDTDTLSGGLQIGVRSILVNSRAGVASFYLGADKIVFSVPSTTDNEFHGGGSVQINNQNIVGGSLMITTATSGSNQVSLTDIKYQLNMDAIGGDAYVPAGSGIRSLLRYPEATLSPDFDIKYEGLTQPTRTNVAVTNNGNDQYQLQFTNVQNVAYTVPFVSNRNGVYQFGDNNHNLVFVEASNATNYNIGANDYFVVTNSPWNDNSVTEVLQYNDIDASNHVLYFTNEGDSSEVQVSYTPNNATNAGTGDLVIGGHSFTVYVNNTNDTSSGAAGHMIAVDQNGDGFMNGAEVGVTVLGGGLLDLMTGFYYNATTQMYNALNASGLGANNLSLVDGHGRTMNGQTWYFANNSSAAAAPAIRVGMSLTTMAKYFNTPTSSEVIDWRIYNQATSPYLSLEHTSNDYSGPMNGNELYNEYVFTTNTGDSTNYYGMTDYGVLIKEYQPTGTNPYTLTLSYPESQVFGQVFVTAGATSVQNGSSSVSTTTVNPIAVGLAVLDKDAPAIGTENMIVVGGPCANTVAAALMGNPTDCAAGFMPGKAMIKSFENNGMVAILVAGYEAQETLGASYVLANYKDYAAFKGSEVEVVVPDLKNIVVQAVSTDNTTAPVDNTTSNTTQ